MLSLEWRWYVPKYDHLEVIIEWSRAVGMFWWNILVRFLKVEPDFCFCETGAKLYPTAAECRGWCYVVEPGQIDRGGRGWVGSDRHLPSSSNADLGKYFHHQAPGTMVMMMFFSYFYNLVIVMMMMLLKMMIRGILLSPAIEVHYFHQALKDENFASISPYQLPTDASMPSR